MKDLSLKKTIHVNLKNAVTKKLVSIDEAISDAIVSRNNESKCSAGDKHETGRAMVQIEIDNYQAQKKEINKLMDILDAIDLETPHLNAGQGSLVHTDMGIFYLSVGMGKLGVDSIEYFAISVASPIGSALSSHAVGDKVTFREKTIIIEAIV